MGHLYQGRYKAILIDQDSYLLELSRYVHLNPVRIRSHQGNPSQEQIGELEKHRWSSFTDMWTVKRNTPGYATTACSGTSEKAARSTDSLSEGMRGGYTTPWESVTAQVVLGEQGFVEQVKRRIDKTGSKREQPSIGELEAKVPETVLREVLWYFGVPEKRLTGKRTGLRDERAVAMEMIYRYANVSQAEIGKMFGGLDYTAVSREPARLRRRIEEEPVLNKAVRGMEMKFVS